MPRIQGVAKEKAGWLLRYARSYARKKTGKDTELTSILGHSNWVLGGVGAFETAMEKATRVDARLKTLAGIKAAAMIGCPF